MKEPCRISTYTDPGMEAPQKPTPIVGFSLCAVHGLLLPADIYPTFDILQWQGYYNPSPGIFDLEFRLKMHCSEFMRQSSLRI
ncbi:MAG: hypothetical protein NT004_13435 [Bacteroidetes bacterium]|nr:hypothetical protein [Bacteroidota bacterium]